jgi:MFS family permease
MQTTGQAWLVLKITDSPIALATVASLQFLPITLFTLFGGAFADRFPRRPVMFVTQSLAMGQALLLGTLAATGTVEIWHIYILASTLGMINALDGPLRQSFVTELVDRESLPNAVALNSLVQNLGRILGPALGGAVIGFFGVETAFFMNAVSFVGILVALALLDRSQRHERVPPGRRGSGVRADDAAHPLPADPVPVHRDVRVQLHDHHSARRDVPSRCQPERIWVAEFVPRDGFVPGGDGARFAREPFERPNPRRQPFIRTHPDFDWNLTEFRRFWRALRLRRGGLGDFLDGR